MPGAPLQRAGLLPEPDLPPAAALLAEGRALARDWRLGECAFLREHGVASEAEYKRRAQASGRLMQHAQLGLREPAALEAAWREVHARCEAAGVRIDRYGVCLDWAMGYPRAQRDGYPRGTGALLDGPEAFARLTTAAPVAPHFGDFVLGFPAAVENTQAALAAGCTAVGNLGQYFTFRLLYWDDDVATTAASVRALGLIAAQDAEVLVHSNLDDGFAAQFHDLACVLGMALIEQHIVETLCGCRLSHCFGHHFSEPLSRWAFHRALRDVAHHPGTMVYGNTLSYRGEASENFASLGGYLLVDALAQLHEPSGHALNPVPVSENRRIPDVDEIVAAQCYAARLLSLAHGYLPLLDDAAVAPVSAQLLTGGRVFRARVLDGLAAAGVDTGDALELLLALRRLGARRLERLFGPGATDASMPQQRRALVPAPLLRALEAQAASALGAVTPDARETLSARGLRLITATTDVHEHGIALVRRVLDGLGLEVFDAGVAADPETVAALAAGSAADAIALSSYNGVALEYYERLRTALAEAGLPALPVILGGRLNQVPAGSNTSLPVEVTDALTRRGARVCADISELVPALLALAQSPAEPRGEAGCSPAGEGGAA